MISETLKNHFNLKGHGIPLAGGQDTSMRFEDLVLKPIDDQAYYDFAASILQRLEPTSYRLSKPVLSDRGRFIEEGYGVTTYEPGHHDDGRVADILQVSKAFHDDLKSLAITDVPLFDNPWAKAQAVLWQGAKLPDTWGSTARDFAIDLLSQLPQVDAPYQVIHADLGGNVLFHDTLKPLVIDFSPTFAPVAYAHAIIVCDSIAWGGAPLDTLKLLQPLKDYVPFILYAVAFRVLTILFFNHANNDRLMTEWRAYQAIWEYALKKIGKEA